MNNQTSVTSKDGIELKIGQRVLVHLDDNGVFHGIVDHFERDGAQAVVMPTRDPVRDVFPKGYNLGSAHWKSQLTLIAQTETSVFDQGMENPGTEG